MIAKFTNPEDRLGVQENLNRGRYTPEQVEMLMLRMATYECSPTLPKPRHVAAKLGITYATYNVWKSDARYIAIMQKLLGAVRDKWEGRVQAKVIEKALEGNKYMVDTFYNLQQRFIKKVEVKHTETISSDPKEIQEEINKITAEISDMETIGPVNKSVTTGSKVARMPKLNGGGGNGTGPRN